VNTGRIIAKNYRSKLLELDHVSITNEAATGVAPIIVDKEGLV
jgi:hypothetical protein